MNCRVCSLIKVKPSKHEAGTIHAEAPAISIATLVTQHLNKVVN